MIIHVSKRLHSRLPYYQRTHPSHIVRSKKDSTDGLIRAIKNLIPGGDSRLRVLSLPGPWWNFERSLRTQTRRKLSFVCCENDPTIFRLASANIPHKRTGASGKVRSKFQSELGNADVVTNGHSTCLINCDVCDQIRVTDKKFNIVYLDFCSPLTPKILECIDNVPRVLAADAVFAIAFMAARESLAMLKSMHPHKSRMAFINDWVETAGFEKRSMWAWNDGSPMVQILFSFTGAEPIIPVGAEVISA